MRGRQACGHVVIDFMCLEDFVEVFFAGWGLQAFAPVDDFVLVAGEFVPLAFVAETHDRHVGHADLIDRALDHYIRFANV